MRKLIVIIIGLVACTLHATADRKEIRIDKVEQIKDYTPIVNKILEEHPQGDICLTFGPGVFPFYPEKARGRYLCVSNNDNGYKRVVFNLTDMQNVVIKGDSTTLLLHGKLTPFLLSRSKQINISGVDIDYDYPFVFEGKVIANSPEEHSFTLQVHPDNPYYIKDNRLFFKGYDWESPLGENIVFLPETHSPIYNTSLYEHAWHTRELKAEEISPGVVKFSDMMSKEVPPVGTVYTDKGPHGKNREVPGFIIQHCSEIQLSGINVYRTGAMALIAEKSYNLSLDSFNICLHNNSDRMISASADATHFVGCKGDILIKNCRFEGMLDDASNIHATYMKVDDILDWNTVGASFGHFQQEGYDFGNKGDSIAFVNRANLTVMAKGKITRVTQLNENYYRIETDVDVRPFHDKKLSIANLSDNAKVHISKCSVRHNRARSLLISTGGPVLIEDCYFASMMAGIRICGDANYWYESGNVKDVTIRNNTFEDLGLGGHAPQAILQIDPVIPPKERKNVCYHGTIRFENNLIRAFDTQVIYALSVDSLIITGNRFIDSRSYPPLFPGLSVIDVQYCNNIVIKQNDFKNWQRGATLSIKECKSQQLDKKMPLEIVINANRYFYQE